jgi:pyruvate dehydrogenase E2 component (dihydrolipoamide acetyltransferase)
MAREVKLPEIAENIDVATVIEVLVSEGDQVKEDQPLIEIETEKAASDVPSPAAGTIKEIKVKEGDEIKIGATILVLEETGGAKEEEEKASEKEGEQAEKTEEKPREEKEDKEEAREEEGPGKEKEEKEMEEKPGQKEEVEKIAPAAEEAKPVPAAPSVRRFAREIGIDIQQVQGTGPGERVTLDDVKAFAKRKNESQTGAGTISTGFQLPDFSRWGETEREPLSKVRQITAQNTLQSWNSIPHVTQFDKADVTALEEFRKKYGKTVEKAGGKLTVTAILLKLASFALEEFPRFNSSLDMDKKEIIYKKYMNIGVAADTERGLLVPVIRDVNKKSLTKLAIELGEMAQKARNKKISPDELQGGNFTISNLGGLGGTNFTPVIFPPQVAILGVARAQTEAVFINGEFKPRLLLPLNLSYDHRVIDGADGARFLRWVCNGLENPWTMFL